MRSIIRTVAWGLCGWLMCSAILAIPTLVLRAPEVIAEKHWDAREAQWIRINHRLSDEERNAKLRECGSMRFRFRSPFPFFNQPEKIIAYQPYHYWRDKLKSQDLRDSKLGYLIYEESIDTPVDLGQLSPLQWGLIHEIDDVAGIYLEEPRSTTTIREWRGMVVTEGVVIGTIGIPIAIIACWRRLLTRGTKTVAAVAGGITNKGREVSEAVDNKLDEWNQ